MKKIAKLEEMGKELAKLRELKKEIAAQEKARAEEVHEAMEKAGLSEYDGEGCRILRVETTVYSIEAEALQDKVGWKKALGCCRVLVGKVKENFGDSIVEEIGEPETVMSLKVERK